MEVWAALWGAYYSDSFSCISSLVVVNFKLIMSGCNVIDVQNPDFKTSPVNVPHRHLYYFQMLVDKSVCLCVAMRVHLCARLCFSLAFVCLLRFVCHNLGIGGQHMLLISRSLFLSACLGPSLFIFSVCRGSYSLAPRCGTTGVYTKPRSLMYPYIHLFYTFQINVVTSV